MKPALTSKFDVKAQRREASQRNQMGFFAKLCGLAPFRQPRLV